jgi:hypothetical protein
MSLFTEHKANVILNSGACAIATDATKVESTVDVLYKVDGTLYPALADGELATLSGSIPDDYQAVYVFYVSFNEVTALPELSISKSENFHKSLYMKRDDFGIENAGKAPICYALVVNETGGTFDG